MPRIKSSVQEVRDKEIVRRYELGESRRSLASSYGITTVRIHQILKKLEASIPTEPRRGPETKPDDHALASKAFLAQYSQLIATVALQGQSRIEIASRFALLEPDVPAYVVQAALTQSSLVFDSNREDFHFSPTVVEAGVWYLLARIHHQPGSVQAAIQELSLEEMTELTEALTASEVSARHVRTILMAVGTCRSERDRTTVLAVSRSRFDKERDQAVHDLGLGTGRGSRSWPPTSQTVMRRLGGGYWADALTALGIAPLAGGRSRGTVLFTPSDYADAITDFIKYAHATDTIQSFEAFEQWVRAEERRGVQRPSGPAVRKFFGSWTQAKRLASDLARPATGGPQSTTEAGSVAHAALHDATRARRAVLDKLKATPARQQPELLSVFVRDYMTAFETRRRDWLRAMICADPRSALRRLEAAGPPNRRRRYLEQDPPDLTAALDDRYLDGLLSKGPCVTDGWLAPEVQEHLDRLPTRDQCSITVLRSTRNLFTHDSREAAVTLGTSLTELAKVDADFDTGMQLTRRSLTQWLCSKGAKRLDTLASGVISAWAAMVAADAIQNG